MQDSFDWGKFANRSLFVVVLAALLGCSASVTSGTEYTQPSVQHKPFGWLSPREKQHRPEQFPNVLNLLDGENPMLALYREDLTSAAVKEFFIRLTGSAETALPILYHADRSDLPLSLAFALTWVESRHSATAVNRNATSVDRGLWQLNSLSFRQLAEEDFFDPEVSSRHGAEYLRRSLRLAGDDPDTALAIYNAGLTRVRRGEIPLTTRRYVQRIRDYQTAIEARFRRYILDRFPATAV